MRPSGLHKEDTEGTEVLQVYILSPLKKPFLTTESAENAEVFSGNFASPHPPHPLRLVFSVES
jgi:hypothetical protein